MDKESLPERFFMVWNPTGRPPSYKHRDRDSAEAEAQRLALQNPGQKFVVMASLCEYTKVEIQKTMHRGKFEDDIPF